MNEFSINMAILRRFFVIFSAIAISVAGSGCASYYDANKPMFTTQFIQGNFAEAKDTIVDQELSPAELYLSSDVFFTGLCAGTAALNADAYSESINRFDMAENAMNQGRTDGYPVKYYEKVMLNTYKALAFLKAGDRNNARVEFNRAYVRQGDAIEENKAAIAEAQKNNEQKMQQNQANVNQTLTAANRQIAAAYPEFQGFQAYSDFANPFTTYLSGLFLLMAAEDHSDIDTGLLSLKRAQAMVPENPYIPDDITMGENLAKGIHPSPMVYVLYEGGIRSGITKLTFRIPFYLGSGVKFAKISLPKLTPQQNPPSGVTILADTHSYPTSLLADIDRIVLGEFEERFPIEVTKAILWMTANLIAQEAAQQAIRQGTDRRSDSMLWGGLAAAAISEISNPVEIRCWDTLPRTIAIAHLPMPTNGSIDIQTPDGALLAKNLRVNYGTPFTVIHIRQVLNGGAAAIKIIPIQ